MKIPPPGMELDFFRVNMFTFKVKMFSYCFQTNGFDMKDISQDNCPSLPYPFSWDGSQTHGWIEVYLIHLEDLAVSLLGMETWKS